MSREERLLAAIELALRELERVQDVRASRISIIGHTRLILEGALADDLVELKDESDL